MAECITVCSGAMIGTHPIQESKEVLGNPSFPGQRRSQLEHLGLGREQGRGQLGGAHPHSGACRGPARTQGHSCTCSCPGC